MRQNIIKTGAIIVLLCVLFTSVHSFSASAATIPTISVLSVKAEDGSSVDVAISLDSNPGLFGIGVRVGYDHSVLTLKSCTAGSVFTSGEVTPPPSLDKETYFFFASKAGVADTKAVGKLFTLTFSVAATAAYKDYPITLEMSSGNTINVKGQDVVFNTVNGKVTVVNCVHKNSTWTTVTAATCLQSGSEKLVCNKCKAVLDTRTIVALGHLFTKKIISDKTKRSDATASKKATYFYTCARDGVISSTLYFSAGDVTAYKVTDGADSEWVSNGDTGLTFTADGDFQKFTGVKIDGALIDKGNYEAKAGSTVVTLNVDYLKTLEIGDHTMTFVYKDGDVSASFKIAEAATDSITNETSAQATVNNVTTAKTTGGGDMWIIIVILIIVILCAVAGLVFFKKGRR